MHSLHDVPAVIFTALATSWLKVYLFPKPLADIGGKTMVERVYERALMAASLDRVIVATDDKRIADAVNALNIADVRVAMTRPLERW